MNEFKDQIFKMPNFNYIKSDNSFNFKGGQLYLKLVKTRS